MSGTAEKKVVLSVENISKSFGAVHALNNIRFDLQEGEVHVLVGENGAGKSTFLNIISGTYTQDTGTIRLNGEEMHFKNPLAAKEKGIIKVHQELQLVPEITVAQNMFLGKEILNKNHTLNYREMEKRADEMLAKLHAGFSSSTMTLLLSTAQQQMVEIAKALLEDFNVLALDEPTASLTDREIEQLFRIVKELKVQGKSIIYISHRMEEIFEICDRVTVFRDGTYIDTADVKDVDKDWLVKKMVGREIGDDNFHTSAGIHPEVVLKVENFTGRNNRFKNICLELHKGEILGLAGLVGAGRTELVRGIFGADRISSGTLTLRGRQVVIRKPGDAMKNGIMLIPEDRKLQGFIPLLNNTMNVALSNMDKYTKHLLINYGLMNRQVKELTNSLDVYPRDNNLLTSQLSGGNQQKVVVAKALNTDPDILILDEPTRGIDVNAKHEIYELIRKLADEGKSIIFISSELPEILKLSDRIIVMYEGKITGEINAAEATEDAVIHYAVGG